MKKNNKFLNPSQFSENLDKILVIKIHKALERELEDHNNVGLTVEFWIPMKEKITDQFNAQIDSCADSYLNILIKKN